MTAGELLAELAARGVVVSLAGGRLKLAGHYPPELAAEVRGQAAAVVALVRARRLAEITASCRRIGAGSNAAPHGDQATLAAGLRWSEAAHAYGRGLAADDSALLEAELACLVAWRKAAEVQP
jgi:hypothetical protein